MIKAIVFDMDGVLIDAKDWHYEALNRALALFGYEINQHEHLTTYDGLPTRRKLEMLTVARGLPRVLHEFINEMKQVYTMEIVNARCKPTFVHERALSSLAAKGYRLAVASNSVRASVEVMMAKSHLAPYFEFMLSNEDVTKAKPDPEIYLSAIQQFGISPSECLVVEDNENGIRAAKDAGAHLLVVGDVSEANLDNVLSRIEQIEGSPA